MLFNYDEQGNKVLSVLHYSFFAFAAYNSENVSKIKSTIIITNKIIL